jgi:hypothetical protein
MRNWKRIEIAFSEEEMVLEYDTTTAEKLFFFRDIPGLIG